MAYERTNMDTQTFLKNLEIHPVRSTQSYHKSSGFYDYFESSYETYISATPKERENVREFVRSASKPQSLFGSLFQSKKETSQIAHLLLVYVKERSLPQLKSTKDTAWLYRGLVAISIDDFTGTFDDQSYTAYPMKGDASFLLADLFVTAEEVGIAPESIFQEMAGLSNTKNKKYLPMNEFMNNAGKDKFAYERRQHGKFIGMF